MNNDQFLEWASNQLMANFYRRQLTLQRISILSMPLKSIQVLEKFIYIPQSSDLNRFNEVANIFMTQHENISGMQCNQNTLPYWILSTLDSNRKASVFYRLIFHRIFLFDVIIQLYYFWQNFPFNFSGIKSRILSSWIFFGKNATKIALKIF